MKTYYEQLDLQPDADEAEIQTAIDSLYNQWRQAVTHPDPGVVEEANRNLRVLEQMRATLTDPVKRAGYDAGIGLGGAAGLADPTAVMRQAPPTPPRPRKTVGQSSDGATSGLWACPKCATDNPPQTKHCFKCGAQLVRMCPNCNQMASLVATGFCGNCGAQYEVAVRLAELRVLQKTASEQHNLAKSQLEQARSGLNALEEPKFLVGTAIGLGLIWLLSFGFRLAGAFDHLGIGLWPLLLLAGFAIMNSQYNSRKSEVARKSSDFHSIEVDAQQRLNAANDELAAYETEMAKLEKQLRPRG